MNESGRPVESINTPKGPPAFPPKKGRSAAYCSRKHFMVKSSAWSPSIHHLLLMLWLLHGFLRWCWLKKGKREISFLKSIRNRTASLNRYPPHSSKSYLFQIENRVWIAIWGPNWRCPPHVYHPSGIKGTSPEHKEVNTRVISASTRIQAPQLCRHI